MAKVRPYKSPYADDRARAQAAFKQHRVTERKSRAFDFRRDDTSNYAFSLTWTPGSLSLAGDVGELTLVHYNALWDLEGGLEWATHGDFDYLLGKSDRRPSYDADATAADIIEFANDRAGHSLRALRDEIRRWRAEKPEADATIEDEAERAECLAEELVYWLEDRPALEKIEFDRHALYGPTLKSCPDGWQLWARIQHEIESYRDPNDILRAGGRGHVRDALPGYLETNDSAAEFCCRIGLDDYYGTTRWTYHDIAQIEAIRFGAAAALRNIRAEPWPARHRNWPAPSRRLA
jgi:hypothetical protein